MNDTLVSIEHFGRDHWSTFAYIETRCVDHGGVPDRRRMRTDRDRHPAYVAPYTPEFSQKYPTRLKSGEKTNHDDWDCAEDLEAAGLIEIKGAGLHPVYKMTDRGNEVAGRLRSHKTKGGSIATFELR